MTNQAKRFRRATTDDESLFVAIFALLAVALLGYSYLESEQKRKKNLKSNDSIDGGLADDFASIQTDINFVKQDINNAYEQAQKDHASASTN